MSKRLSNIGLEIEYKNPPHSKRLTNIGLVIEYAPRVQYTRATNLSLLVEYWDQTIIQMARANISGNLANRGGGRQ